MSSDYLTGTFLQLDATIKDAIARINDNGCGIVLIVDADQKLLGTITDGDVRRALLKGAQLEDSVNAAMHCPPLTSPHSSGIDQAKRLIAQKQVRQIPMIDDDGRVVDLIIEDKPSQNKRRKNRVIIMAGGIGQRLRPLTENVPKPMLEIGGKPILQGIIESLVSQGLYKFTICLNYLGSIVEDHFGDGAEFGAEITYTRETRRMGTGGALSLLDKRPDTSCIVMNGDILTKLDFRSLRDFHEDHSAAATISLNEYTVSIPFGVIETKDGMVTQMVEKPSHCAFVNAGIYMLSPQVFDHIEPDTEFNMPDLMEKLIAQGQGVAGFPIFEHWLDIGRHADLNLARNET